MPKPKIRTDIQQDAVLAAAWDALRAAETKPEVVDQILAKNRGVLQIRDGDRFRACTANDLRQKLWHVADWVRIDRSGAEVPSEPSSQLISIMRRGNHQDFPAWLPSSRDA